MVQFKSATEVTTMIRDREISSQELVKSLLSHIQKHNSKVNAVIQLDEEGALSQAKHADSLAAKGKWTGPLHGLPITIKDSISTKGFINTYGLPQYKNYRPNQDAEVVRRLRNAGAIIIGKTNLPFAAFDWQCKHPIYGTSNNPWDPKHTPGGSSGGAACALAMGFSYLEVGSDIGGSIRYPAHCSGVYGLRPTEGIIPLDRMAHLSFPNVFRNLVTMGPLSRTAKDLELNFKILSGNILQDETCPNLSQVRVLWSDKIGSVPTSKDSLSVFHGFIQNLEKNVASLEEKTPNFDIDENLNVFGTIAGYEHIAFLPQPLRSYLIRQFFRVGMTRWIFGSSNLSIEFDRGLFSSLDRYVKALTSRDRMMLDMHKNFDSADIWITPASPLPAVAHHKVGKPIKVDGVEYPYSRVFGDSLVPFVTLGHPVAVIPIGFSSTGLPIGVQIHAKRFRDSFLVKIIQQLAQVAGFEGAGKRPPLAE